MNWRSRMRRSRGQNGKTEATCLEAPKEPVSPDLETKSAFPSRTSMPIAKVAGDTAGQAALEEVAREMTTAETEGRIIKRLPLSKIGVHHLCRDRLVLDPDDMAALKASLASRGQQTPIEVINLGNQYGLISGMRRVVALKELGETHVLALIRTPRKFCHVLSGDGRGKRDPVRSVVFRTRQHRLCRGRAGGVCDTAGTPCSHCLRMQRRRSGRRFSVSWLCAKSWGARLPFRQPFPKSWDWRLLPRWRPMPGLRAALCGL